MQNVASKHAWITSQHLAHYLVVVSLIELFKSCENTIRHGIYKTCVQRPVSYESSKWSHVSIKWQR